MHSALMCLQRSLRLQRTRFPPPVSWLRSPSETRGRRGSGALQTYVWPDLWRPVITCAAAHPLKRSVAVSSASSARSGRAARRSRFRLCFACRWDRATGRMSRTLGTMSPHPWR